MDASDRLAVVEPVPAPASSCRFQVGFRFGCYGPPVRLLVVDDDAAVLDALERALRTEGYCVDCVRCGYDALATQADRPADAVVLDLRLPDLDGLEVCRRLR